MRRLRAAVPDEYSALNWLVELAPENDVTLIAGKEVGPGFVARSLVQLNAENVPVIQHAQAPAIHLIERAGPVSPRHADHPANKIRGTEVPCTRLDHKGDRCCYLMGW